MAVDKPVLDDVDENRAETYREKELRHQIEKYLKTWGEYGSVDRFARKYGKLTTRREYLCDLDLYFRWLTTVGVTMNPDELIKDNLRCVYESKATDVETKRKHTDLLLRYANSYLVENGNGYSSRHRKVAAVRQFYLRNDSTLFGDFVIADGKAEKQRKIPSADDIREVLKSLPVDKRAPLVLMWQTGAEPSAVLALTWSDVKLEGAFIKLDFVGRKRHRRPYFKLAGKDSINLLKIWKEEWRGIVGREPSSEDLCLPRQEAEVLARAWASLTRLAELMFQGEGHESAQPGACIER